MDGSEMGWNCDFWVAKLHAVTPESSSCRSTLQLDDRNSPAWVWHRLKDRAKCLVMRTTAAFNPRPMVARWSGYS